MFCKARLYDSYPEGVRTFRLVLPPPGHPQHLQRPGWGLCQQPRAAAILKIQNLLASRCCKHNLIINRVRSYLTLFFICELRVNLINSKIATLLFVVRFIG